jgi:hypothetical protein
MADTIVEGIKDKVSVAIKVNQSVGIQVPENRHADLIEALFHSMFSNDNDVWTFLTANDTFDHISRSFREELSHHKNVNFIDCISKAAGITKLQEGCTYIESPTMLEIATLEIMNTFRDVNEDVEKFIVIDSLSALVIYNNPEIIQEFVSVLMNRARSKNIHVVSILIEEEVDTNKLIQMNDKIVVLRDSFIE